MGREVRMVPANWEHPKYDANHPEVVNKGRTFLVGQYVSKFKESYNQAVIDWNDGKNQWENGLCPTYSSTGPKYAPKSEYEKKISWREFAGPKPKTEDYMPNWTEEERTHYMMYETTSEGTPISPAFATPEELAKWLADTGASSFADSTATYDQWLSTIKRGFAVSAVLDDNGLRSGVEGLHEEN